MVALVVLGSFAGAIALIGSVGAAPTPLVPAITAGPSGNVAATSATFKYSDATSGVSFHCALDSGSFKSCGTSGVTYTGLSHGAHTFKVEATKSSATSTAAIRMWTVDTTGPTVSATFPANLHSYGTGSWSAGCASGPGICGTAADASGVASVRVGVLSLTTLRYWNGSSFGHTGQFLLPATGTTSWRLPMPAPPTGLYGVLVSATDALGNVRPVAQILLFSTNTTPPPAPVITTHPTSPTTAQTAMLMWTDSQAGVAFKCSLDSATATPCTSPTSYSNMTAGDPCFSVVAVDAVGNTSLPATFCWVITSATPPPPPAPTITGNPTASSTSPTGTFTFSDSQAGVTFECSLDSATAVPCTSPASYTNLDVTNHCFSVVAVDSINQTSPPASFCWTITMTTFPVTGGPIGSFSPGTSQYVNLSITNPNSFSITVTGVTATVSPTTSNASCVGNTNLVQSQAFTGPVTIPANSTKTLQQLGVPQSQWLQLTMPNLGTNQDACKGATFQISYSGTATL